MLNLLYTMSFDEIEPPAIHDPILVQEFAEIQESISKHISSSVQDFNCLFPKTKNFKVIEKSVIYNFTDGDAAGDHSQDIVN